MPPYLLADTRCQIDTKLAYLAYGRRKQNCEIVYTIFVEISITKLNLTIFCYQAVIPKYGMGSKSLRISQDVKLKSDKSPPLTVLHIMNPPLFICLKWHQ